MYSFDNCDVAFFTKDRSRAYRLREKCLLDTKNNIEYLSSIAEICKFIFTKTMGVIFIDINNFGSMHILINDFCKSRNKGEFVFVYVCDEQSKSKIEKNHIQINNVNTFLCDISQMSEYVGKSRDLLKAFREKYLSRNKSGLKNYIISALESFRISPKLIGFDYLIEAIWRYFNYKGTHKSLSADIYPDIAKLFDTTPDNVEKSIRLAIKKANDSHPELFDIDVFKNCKVTSRTFVAYLSDDIVTNINLGLKNRLF